jgi:hypothetical protein
LPANTAGASCQQRAGGDNSTINNLFFLQFSILIKLGEDGITGEKEMTYGQKAMVRLSNGDGTEPGGNPGDCQRLC